METHRYPNEAGDSKFLSSVEHSDLNLVQLSDLPWLSAENLCSSSSTALPHHSDLRSVSEHSFPQETQAKPKKQPQSAKDHLEDVKEFAKELDIEFDPNADSINELRLFVGHVKEDTNASHITKYFKQYGEVIDVYLPRKPQESVHRGVAFVTLKNSKKLLGTFDVASNHVINGRRVIVEVIKPLELGAELTQTILVSGLIQNTTNETIKAYFQTFGSVSHISRGETRRKKSRWAMVHFDSVKTVKKVFAAGQHIIDGHVMQVRCTRSDSTKNYPDEMDIRKLIVGRLNPNTKVATLKDYFGKYGKIIDSYIPVVKNDTKNFGYVIMHSQDVTFGFYGHIIDGSCVYIEDEKSTRTHEPVKTLLISASPETMEKVKIDDIHRVFKKFGNIIDTRKPLDPKTKKATHCAFVEYSSAASVDEAMSELNLKLKILLISYN